MTSGNNQDATLPTLTIPPSWVGTVQERQKATTGAATLHGNVIVLLNF